MCCNQARGVWKHQSRKRLCYTAELMRCSLNPNVICHAANTQYGLWHRSQYRSRGACQLPPVLCLHLFLSTVQSFSTTPLSLHCSVLNQLLAHSPTSFCHLPRPPGRARHIHQSHTIKMLPSQHGGAIGRTIIETMIYGPHQVCNCVFTCVCMLLRNGTA